MKRELEKEPLLTPPSHLSFSSIPLYMQSFTGLKKKSGNASALVGAPHDWAATEKTIHTLPAGAVTGIVLHAILEHLPFEEAKKADKPEDFIRFIAPHCKGTLLTSWEFVLAETLFSLFRMPLEGLGFALKDLDPRKMMRETPFIFSSEEMPEMEEADAFLKGVMDLVFEHGGKFYLVDWKSNWLGSGDASYTPQLMAQAMQDNRYDLQSMIYKEALRRHIALFDSRPFDALFGKVLYVFIRGKERGLFFD